MKGFIELHEIDAGTVEIAVKYIVSVRSRDTWTALVTTVDGTIHHVKESKDAVINMMSMWTEK